MWCVSGAFSGPAKSTLSAYTFCACGVYTKDTERQLNTSLAEVSSVLHQTPARTELGEEAWGEASTCKLLYLSRTTTKEIETGTRKE